MPTLVVTHAVRDFDEWKQMFATGFREMWATAGPRLGLESPRAWVVEIVERKDY